MKMRILSCTSKSQYLDKLHKALYSQPLLQKITSRYQFGGFVLLRDVMLHMIAKQGYLTICQLYATRTGFLRMVHIF